MADVGTARQKLGATSVSWRPDRLEIEVQSDQPGIVIAHEIYYPGWVAEIDGKPARILRANVLFRGVEVGEGRHVIVFRFEPFSLANLSRHFWACFAATSERDGGCHQPLAPVSAAVGATALRGSRLIAAMLLPARAMRSTAAAQRLGHDGHVVGVGVQQQEGVEHDADVALPEHQVAARQPVEIAR